MSGHRSLTSKTIGILFNLPNIIAANAHSIGGYPINSKSGLSLLEKMHYEIKK